MTVKLMMVSYCAAYPMFAYSADNGDNKLADYVDTMHIFGVLDVFIAV